MTFVLKTPQGEIESGFCAYYTQLARLGLHVFTTRGLCELVRILAENQNIKKTQILAYNQEKFYKGLEKNTLDFLQRITEAERSGIPELKETTYQKYIPETQGEAPLEDQINFDNEGALIEVQVTPDEKTIKIGEYIIPAKEFGIFAVYIAGGGFFGWHGKGPNFAQSTLHAIKNSSRELYKEVSKRAETK